MGASAVRLRPAMSCEIHIQPRHARLFFGSADLGLDTATYGTFTLTPSQPMREALARVYMAMGGMVFGPLPNTDGVLHSIEELESRLNMPDA